MKWEDESSIRGKIMSEMIRHLTSLEGVGKKLQDGTLRQNGLNHPGRSQRNFVEHKSRGKTIPWMDSAAE